MNNLSLSLGTQLASSGASWNPITGLGSSLLAYWDADTASSLTLSGSNVTTWADVKNGYAVTQAVSGSKPIYSATGLNNRGAVTFDGTDDFLELASQPFPSANNGSEIWALVNQTALVADTTARGIAGYGTDLASTSRYDIRRVITGVNRGGVGGAATVSNTAADFSGIHVIRGRFEATQISVSIDGNTAATGAAIPNTGTTRVRIGATPLAAPTYFQGAVNALIVTSLLTTDQATQLTQYLKTRGGIS